MAKWKSTTLRLPYSESDWAAILAILKKLPRSLQAKAEEDFRFDIESSAYLIKFGSVGPTTQAKWKAAWQKVAKLSTALRNALAVVVEEETQEAFDAWCSARINEANHNISSLRKPAWPRRDNPDIEQLVGQLLGLWSYCGGKLKFSRGASGARAKGPLIRFLKTATDPARSLEVEHLAYLIKKMRAGRNRKSSIPKKILAASGRP